MKTCQLGVMKEVIFSYFLLDLSVLTFSSFSSC